MSVSLAGTEADSLDLTRHLANLLTGLRLVLSVPIVLLVLSASRQAHEAAVALFAAAAVTDLLDGYAARRWQTVSALGKFLDPLADKAIVDGCILALLFRSAFPLPVAALLLVRDLAVTSLRVRRAPDGDPVSPGVAAKAKTFCLYTGIGGLLLDSHAAVIAWCSWLLVGLAAVLSLLSLAGYLRGRWTVHCSRGLLWYLVLPRPGPLLSTGKVGFFLLGSFLAISAGARVASPLRWLLVLLLYELAVNQAKYQCNDVCGRMSDRYFLRGNRNRCPRHGAGPMLLLGFAMLRAGLGLGALFVYCGWVAAIAGALTLLLQLLYEVMKRQRLPGRGGWLFAFVSANYGVRALAGVAAVSSAAVLSPAGALVFLWAAGLGGLFLSIYWQRQGAFYIRGQQLSPALLARYKPGVLACYRRALLAARSGRTRLEHTLLFGLATGAVLFVTLGPGQGRLLFVSAGIAYACVGLAGLVAACGLPVPSRRRLTPSAALLGLTIAGTALAGLYLRTPCLLPSTLLAIALLTYLVISSPAADGFILDGSLDGAGDHAAASV